MYRMLIDVPMGEDLEKAKELAEHLAEIIKLEFYGEGLSVVQFKLSNDTDRSNKNYLDINENGHCSNKKIKIYFGGAGEDETL